MGANSYRSRVPVPRLPERELGLPERLVLQFQLGLVYPQFVDEFFRVFPSSTGEPRGFSRSLFPASLPEGIGTVCSAGFRPGAGPGLLVIGHGEERQILPGDLTENAAPDKRPIGPAIIKPMVGIPAGTRAPDHRSLRPVRVRRSG